MESVYQRANFSKTRDVSASAKLFYKQLVNWADIVDWPGPVSLSKCVLAPDHELGKLPCTRHVYPDLSKIDPGTAAMMPEYFAETLILADEVVRTIAYRVENMFGGMRNYLATTTVDVIDDNRCRVTCWSRVDIPEGAPLDVIKATFEDTYERGVIGGIAAKIGAKVL